LDIDAVAVVCDVLNKRRNFQQFIDLDCFIQEQLATQ
jgi:hypothetical protein